jgi:hypothetical protein
VVGPQAVQDADAEQGKENEKAVHVVYPRVFASSL